MSRGAQQELTVVLVDGQTRHFTLRLLGLVLTTAAILCEAYVMAIQSCAIKPAEDNEAWGVGGERGEERTEGTPSVPGAEITSGAQSSGRWDGGKPEDSRHCHLFVCLFFLCLCPLLPSL